MVCEFGMSPLGNVAYKADADGNMMISAELAAKIDAEVSKLIDDAYASALRILREKQDRLEAISEHLIQVETIDGAELDRMLFAA
jgi:cell division protease FtsH